MKNCKIELESEIGGLPDEISSTGNDINIYFNGVTINIKGEAQYKKLREMMAMFEQMAFERGIY